MEILVVFSTTNHLLSRIIKKVTKSQVSHTSIWMDLAGVPVVLQASIGGVKVVPLEKWLKSNQVVKKFRPKVDVSDGLKEAVKLLNTKYDYVGLVGYAFVMIGRWFKKKVKNPLASPSKVVCSEFVLRLDYNDRIPEWNDLEWETTDPQLLMESCGESFELSL